MHVPCQASLNRASINKGATQGCGLNSQLEFTWRQEATWERYRVRCVPSCSLLLQDTKACELMCHSAAKHLHSEFHGQNPASTDIKSKIPHFVQWVRILSCMFLQVSKENCSKCTLMYLPPLVHPSLFECEHRYLSLKLRSHFLHPQMEINSLWKWRSKYIKTFTQLEKPV